MDLVIDTSAIIAVIANEAEKPGLIKCTIGATLYAPTSVSWEIGNAFSAMLRRKRISLSQARVALAAYHQIPIRFIDIDISKALAHSERLSIYAYDAYIIEAAMQQQCLLLTLDHGLRYAAKEAGVGIMEVVI